MATESILSTVRQYLNADPMVRITLEPLVKGASGRTIVRIKTDDREPFIGIHWTDERADSDYYPAISHFLKKAGLNVPEIYHENLKWRVLLMEDLGDIDLTSLKNAAWEEREPYYRSAFAQLDKLFFTRGAKDLELSPDFTPGMYRWEQEYFFEHMVEGYLQMDASKLRAAPEFQDLAQRLGASAKNLVHRDFQSQNFLLKDQKSYWLDFQGMRRGRQEYDLASLIYDPYMDHSADDQERLLALWEDVSEERPVDKIFKECALQRLMQALGAYGNIILHFKKDWYKQHVPVAARLLKSVTKDTEFAPLLSEVLAAAETCETE